MRARLAAETPEAARTRCPARLNAAPRTAPTRPAPMTPTVIVRPSRTARAWSGPGGRREGALISVIQSSFGGTGRLQVCDRGAPLVTTMWDLSPACHRELGDTSRLTRERRRHGRGGAVAHGDGRRTVRTGRLLHPRRPGRRAGHRTH